ncbi:MAG: hypothetical protein KAQ94_01160 [Arcobacteraceae bacterium]|nr:hypothetical protein [Arcobacteraceae bacterium]
MKTINIKIFISLMFLTGLLQLDLFNISWEYLTTIRAVHVIGSLTLAIFLIIPFANTHTFEFLIIKKINSKDGLILGLILFLVIASGLYLFLVGNRGGDIFGLYAFNIHLFGAFFLVGSLIYHIKKVKTRLKTFALFFILAFSISTPTVSYSEDKLTLIKLSDNVKRYHSEDWTNSAKCKSCHEEIFNQWADSNHKNITSANPYYMVSEALAAEDKGEEFRQWCMGCHNPSAVTTKQSKTSHGMDGNFLSNEMFEKGAKTLLNEFKKHGNFRLEEGVSCVACHRITEASSKGNASYSLDLTNRKKYTFEDSSSDTGRWLSEKFINSKPEVHKKSYSKELYKESKYCASCHNEFLPSFLSKSGKKVVSTFDEWEKSPFNNPKDPSKHKTCIDCHMTNLENGDFSPLKGQSTKGGKIKKDIKVHYFSGSNHFLSGLKSKTHEDQTIQLLKTSAKLDVDIKDGKLIVGVKNVGAGHHLPTGVADFRELWLDITVKDKDGQIVFQSGKLKKDGDLGKEARVFMKVFGDKNGEPVGLLFWRYEKLLSDTRIPSGERRVETYDMQLKNIKYPLMATVKLNFRIYPQWVTSGVQKVYPQLPNPPVVELNKIIKEFKK